jgi:hypothetical protein
MSAGLDSVAAAEFAVAVSGELRTHLSSVVLFDYPTLESIASHLDITRRLPKDGDVHESRPTLHAGRHVSTPRAPVFHDLISVAAMRFHVTGSNYESEMRFLVSRPLVTPVNVPRSRWVASADAAASACYGSFLVLQKLNLDPRSFRVSELEA